ncbi:MAG: ComEC/Rec2 family competence protein [Betaproteobacteria bacterium]|nr:ComEC/Rec2 family competence protein [Betaproteobacteria bacterium]
MGSRILVKLNAGKPEGSQALSPLSAIRSGSVWQIDLRLSALHGQRNPAGTDLERLALQSDWVARGRAPLSHSRQLEALAMHPLAWVHRTRQVVRDAIRRASAEPGSMPRAMAVIEALVIGSGEGLDPEQWDAFNRTGVGHLLSISGSHVTMFAGFAAFFGVTLLQRAGSFGLLGLRWYTMQLPRVCFAAFGAIAYTLLAGFGLPAQRTCAMVLVTGVMSLSGRRHAPQAVLSCAAVMVCLIDPWAVISPGFWLSFAAVAALVIVVAVLSCWLLIWPLAPWPRWTASLLMLPLMFWPVDRPREGELRVLFFDVGQGSAVFVQSQEFSLLYDSGPAFSLDARADGRNAGFQLVLPTLRSRGIASIDWLVLSHADLDHTGGALSLYRHLRIGQVLSGSPAAEPSLRDLPVVPCSRATELRVRNSSLRFLHPELTEAGASTSGSEDWGRLTRSAKSRSANRNAQSCVLLIEHRGRRLLLPGDLPSLQETAVLLREPAQAGSALDVLLLGHHGASNSSAAPWLDYWRPQLAVVQAGYRNRYGHPHDATLARLCERSIPLRRTDLEGAIELTIGSDGLMHWKFERERTQRYWTRLLAPAVSCPAENGPEGLGTKSHH